MTDIIVTGMPRGGLTVASALIDGLPDCVCLNAPHWQQSFTHHVYEPVPYCKWLIGDFIWRRRQLLHSQPIEDYRAENGAALFDGVNDSRQPYTAGNEPRKIEFSRAGLTSEFTLAMKQHTLYSALLPTLAESEFFRIVAILRHPLDLIASWHASSEMPLGRGNPSGIKVLWPEAMSLISSGEERLDILVKLYELYCERYHALRDRVTILTYEAIVREPSLVGRALGVKGVSVNEGGVEMRQRVRQSRLSEAIRERLGRYGAAAKFYYPDV